MSRDFGESDHQYGRTSSQAWWRAQPHTRCRKPFTIRLRAWHPGRELSLLVLFATAFAQTVVVVLREYDSVACAFMAELMLEDEQINDLESTLNGTRDTHGGTKRGAQANRDVCQLWAEAAQKKQ